MKNQDKIMNKKTFKRLFIENLSGKIETSKDKKISNLQNKMRKNWKICQKKILNGKFFVISIKSNLFFGKCFSC
jgi:hypothetical protein